MLRQIRIQLKTRTLLPTTSANRYIHHDLNTSLYYDIPNIIFILKSLIDIILLTTSDSLEK